MKDITFHILSILLLVLFFWIILPYKWIVRASFNMRKHRAIEEAIFQSEESGKRRYVIQNGKEFHVMSREEARKWSFNSDNKHRRRFQGFLNIDYRNAIIYQTKLK